MTKETKTEAVTAEDKVDLRLTRLISRALDEWHTKAQVFALVSGLDGRRAHSCITFALLTQIAGIAAATTVDTPESNAYWPGQIARMIAAARKRLAEAEKPAQAESEPSVTQAPL